MDVVSRISYFTRSFLHCADRARKRCPACGCIDSTLLERKWLVTSLRKCSQCRLQFRTPTTTSNESVLFYQRRYHQGFTTEMPTEQALGLMRASHFRDTGKDFSEIVAIMRSLGAADGSRILDYGCSWGYGSWQLAEAGFVVRAYEVSEPRSRYASEKLDVSLVDPASEPPGSYDFFFSSHVIEHVPDPSALLATGLRLLRPGGVFVALTPNGSWRYREAAPAAWSHSWGCVHPQLICDEWVLAAAKSSPCFVSATPVDHDALRAWRGGVDTSGNLIGAELLFAIRAPGIS